MNLNEIRLNSGLLPGNAPRPPSVFTEADGKAIQEWARQLDDWLVLWNKPIDSEHVSRMIFRQYASTASPSSQSTTPLGASIFSPKRSFNRAL